jgi:hypothetical protein
MGLFGNDFLAGLSCGMIDRFPPGRQASERRLADALRETHGADAQNMMERLQLAR